MQPIQLLNLLSISEQIEEKVGWIILSVSKTWKSYQRYLTIEPVSVTKISRLLCLQGENAYNSLQGPRTRGIHCVERGTRGTNSNT
jgi:hypothetical protein